jgi:hypothetical protein
MGSASRGLVDLRRFGLEPFLVVRREHPNDKKGLKIQYAGAILLRSDDYI